MPASKSGHAYCMVLVDLATSKTSAMPLKALNSSATSAAIQTFFSINPISLYLVTDQGPKYGKTFTETLAKLNVTHRKTKPNHSTARSNVERAIRTAKTALLRICSSQLTTNYLAKVT